jgi:hypothetical protein
MFQVACDYLPFVHISFSAASGRCIHKVGDLSMCIFLERKTS